MAAVVFVAHIVAGCGFRSPCRGGSGFRSPCSGGLWFS